MYNNNEFKDSIGAFSGKSVFIILFILNEGIVSFNIYGSGEVHKYRSDSLISIDNWNHIVVLYDYSKGRCTLFLNSIEDNSAPTIIPYYESKYHAVIGNNRWDSSGSERAPLNGVVDEIRIYNRALSSTEIENLYENP